MRKKLLAVLMTGIMAMSFAATTTAVYAKGDDDNILCRISYSCFCEI